MNSLWKPDYGSPTFDAINERFGPPKYRVSRSIIDEQSEISGTMLSGTCFVIAGVALIEFQDVKFDLSAGDIVDLPKGKFRLIRSGDEHVELVYVWILPSDAIDS
ncbi:MAG: hypothetical protein AAF939_22220 [Planctomycetota bacterium]